MGENKDIRIDVRIIAATNEPLINMVKESKFRDDLYHRINEFKIKVPPLRERPGDILIFADHFRKLSNDQLDRSVEGFTDPAKEMITRYAWEGNLRELRNVIKRSVLLCRDSMIDIQHLPEELSSQKPAGEGKTYVPSDASLKEASHQAEKQVILEALRKANFNKSRAAKLLEIDRKTLYNKINKLDIELEE
jgi:two-component system response regulator HydG